MLDSKIVNARQIIWNTCKDSFIFYEYAKPRTSCKQLVDTSNIRDTLPLPVTSKRMEWSEDIANHFESFLSTTLLSLAQFPKMSHHSLFQYSPNYCSSYPLNPSQYFVFHSSLNVVYLDLCWRITEEIQKQNLQQTSHNMYNIDLQQIKIVLITTEKEGTHRWATN